MEQEPVTEAAEGSKQAKKSGFARLVAKFGFWGAMAFFTVKGLLWLIVPALLAYFSCG